MAEPVALMNARSMLNAPPSRHWYVAQSHVHAESKAAIHLGRLYLPRYRKQRRHARRIDVVAAPLFPLQRQAIRYESARGHSATAWVCMRGSAAIIGLRFCSICWAARFAWYSTTKRSRRHDAILRFNLAFASLLTLI